MLNSCGQHIIQVIHVRTHLQDAKFGCSHFLGLTLVSMQASPAAPSAGLQDPSGNNVQVVRRDAPAQLQDLVPAYVPVGAKVCNKTGADELHAYGVCTGRLTCPSTNEVGMHYRPSTHVLIDLGSYLS